MKKFIYIKRYFVIPMLLFCVLLSSCGNGQEESVDTKQSEEVQYDEPAGNTVIESKETTAVESKEPKADGETMDDTAIETEESGAGGSDAMVSERELEECFQDWNDTWINTSEDGIIGSVLIPDAQMQARLDEAEADGIIGDDGFISPDICFQDSVVLLDDKPSFKSFYIGIDNTLVVKTSDGVYVDVNKQMTSVHQDSPTFIEYDLDADGENELIIQPHILHGTGYREDMAVIVDKDDEDKWSAYLLLPELYTNEFTEHVSGRLIGDEVRLYLDGEEVGVPVNVSQLLKDGEEPCLYMESLVEIFPYAGSLYVSTSPLVTPYPMYNQFTGDKFWCIIDYAGAGEFKCREVMWRQDGDILYNEEKENLEEGKSCFIWDNPEFDIPLLMTMTRIEDPLFEDSAFSFDVFCKMNDELISFGEINAGGTAYPLSIGPRGLYCRNNHSLYIYEPDFAGQCMVIRSGAEDNVLSDYVEHEGFISIRDGQADSISEAEYNLLANQYYYEAHPIECHWTR